MESNQAAESPGDLVLIYVPVPSEEVAVAIGKHLVVSRLAACANILGPMRSIYEWKGTLEDQTEWVLLAKTRVELTRAVLDEIGKRHPYECPAMDVLSVLDAPPLFRKWVLAQTRDLEAE